MHLYLYIHILSVMNCPRDKMADDVTSKRLNGWRRSVPATKRLATNCNGDETARDEVPPRLNGRRRNGGNETAATKRGVPLVAPTSPYINNFVYHFQTLYQHFSSICATMLLNFHVILELRCVRRSLSGHAYILVVFFRTDAAQTKLCYSRKHANTPGID